MTHTFTLTEHELEGLLAAAEYSKRAEIHVAEIQNCVYMKRVTKDVGDTIDRLRSLLHQTRRLKDPIEDEPLSFVASNVLVQIQHNKYIPFQGMPGGGSEFNELLSKGFIDTGQICAFEKIGSAAEWKPAETPIPVYVITDKGRAMINALVNAPNQVKQ